MKTGGKRWKWAWWLLVAGVGLRFYFVQELVAVFALFAIGFAAFTVVVWSLYMLHKGWAATVARFANSEGLSGRSLQTGRSAREMP